MTADFAPHNMTSNNAPAPYVVSASTEYNSDLAANKAFNGSVGTNAYWIATTSTGWLKIFVSGSYVLANYSVQVNSIPEPNRAPKAWTLEGSNDNLNWDTLDTVTNQTAWGNAETRNFTCDTATNHYTYFRIVITENNGDGLLQIGELYLYGDLYIPPPSYLMYRGHSRLNLLPISGGFG